ncbi:hypothetical protein PO124_15285 [Bacillus licheniformis]|nr:hypothetical protein [Bacillus licheniformis]
MMGSIVHERNQGSLSLVMARPVSPLQYIGSKWLQQVLLVLVSFAASYGLAFYYTNLLFGKVEFDRFYLVYPCTVYGLYLSCRSRCFQCSVSPYRGIAGMSICFIAFVSLAGSLFPRFTEWMPDKAKARLIIYHARFMGPCFRLDGVFVFGNCNSLFMCTVLF